MIVLGIPVLEQHELTKQCIESMVKTVTAPHLLHVVIIDNGSAMPYKQEEFHAPFAITIIRNKGNQGFYYPLLELYNRFGTHAEFIGLMHNDVYFYEKNWVERMHYCFNKDQELMLLGLCGSSIVDINGGRGLGTMANFRGEKGAKVLTSVDGVAAAAVLDSLFMLFRGSFIPNLQIDENITPCHFYDKIWSLKVIEQGKRVAVLGIESDHMGGQTSCSPTYQEDAVRWCKEHNVTLEQQDGHENGDLTLYHEGERRYLGYFREYKKLIPLRVDRSYKLWHL